MLWSGSKLKNLRRSLGWHEADLARRLKVTVAEVKSWEAGSESIPDLVIKSLLLLEDHMEANRQSLLEDPLAESQMKEQQVNQINSKEI